MTHTKHPRAELMLQYAQDALETDRPELLWEFALATNTAKWHSMQEGYNPAWNSPDFVYRRRPKTININGFEVPEPLREAPKEGTPFFDTLRTLNDLVDQEPTEPRTWKSSKYDFLALEAGLVHPTKEAAELHAKALLSFTQL